MSWMQKQFEQIAGDDNEIDLNEFKKALGVKKVSDVLHRFLFDVKSSNLSACHLFYAS